MYQVRVRYISTLYLTISGSFKIVKLSYISKVVGSEFYNKTIKKSCTSTIAFSKQPERKNVHSEKVS